MKRIGGLALVLAVVFCIEGCRRSSSEKKPAVAVLVEKDFIFAKPPDDFIKGLKPEGKEDAIPTNDEENKAQQEKQEAAQKIREAGEKKKVFDDVEKVGQALLTFLRTSPRKEHSRDKFKSYLRRAGLVELRKEVESDQIIVSFLALPDVPNHIVAYSKNNSGDATPAYEIGPPNFPNHPAVTLGATAIEERIGKQELASIFRQVWEFSIPYYVNMPADGPGATSLKNRLNLGLPRDALTTLRAQAPQLIKNPPDRRDMEKFKRYLAENASPEMQSAIEGKFRVNLSGDFMTPTDLIVCRGTIETGRGQLAMTSLGALNYYSQDEINQRFLQK